MISKATEQDITGRVCDGLKKCKQRFFDSKQSDCIECAAKRLAEFNSAPKLEMASKAKPIVWRNLPVEEPKKPIVWRECY